MKGSHADDRVLFVFDIGDTLAQKAAGAATALQHLIHAVPSRDPADVGRIYRERLQVADDTPQARRDVAALLGIDPTVLDEYESPPLTLCAGTDEVLASLHKFGASMVGLSNVSPLDRPQVEWVRRATQPWLLAVHTSYELGVAKPDPAVFHRLADLYQVDTANIIMVGDRWEVDILGAQAVGARALWLTPSAAASAVAAEVHGASTLREALPILRQWAARRASGSRSAHPYADDGDNTSSGDIAESPGMDGVGLGSGTGL